MKLFYLNSQSINIQTVMTNMYFRRTPSFFTYLKVVVLALGILFISKLGYAQTFPVLPNPNYDVAHTSLVKGTVTQNGSGGIAGILVRLKSSDGNIISNVLTDDLGNYELTAKATATNYTLEIQYPTDGFSVSSSPSVFTLADNEVKTGMDFNLERKANTLTVCDVHSLTPTNWGANPSPVYLNLTKPNVSTVFNSVKLFTSAATSHPLLEVQNTNAVEPARVTLLNVGANVTHGYPPASSSHTINSAMEFAKNDAFGDGSDNLVIPGATKYTYYNISSGETWSSSNLSDAAYNTDGTNFQIRILATGIITSTITGGNASTNVQTNANAGACLVYTYSSDPLPVSLISFDVTGAKGEPNLLKWKTAEETKSKEFQVEKSHDAREWYTIGTVSTVNKGVHVAEYQLYDSEIWSGTTYYRLKMVDLDGSFSYSKIRRISGDKSSKAVVFPNPIAPESGQKLRFDGVPSQIQKIEFVTISGSLAHKIDYPDTNEVSVDQLAKGLYVVKLIFQNGQILSSRLLIN
jgi:hypothetical protein